MNNLVHIWIMNIYVCIYVGDLLWTVSGVQSVVAGLYLCARSRRITTRGLCNFIFLPSYLSCVLQAAWFGEPRGHGKIDPHFRAFECGKDSLKYRPGTGGLGRLLTRLSSVKRGAVRPWQGARWSVGRGWLNIGQRRMNLAAAGWVIPMLDLLRGGGGGGAGDKPARQCAKAVRGALIRHKVKLTPSMSGGRLEAYRVGKCAPRCLRQKRQYKVVINVRKRRPVVHSSVPIAAPGWALAYVKRARCHPRQLGSGYMNNAPCPRKPAKLSGTRLTSLRPAPSSGAASAVQAKMNPCSAVLPHTTGLLIPTQCIIIQSLG